MNINHLINRTRKKVQKEQSSFTKGDIVKLRDVSNTRVGLDKAGRTGEVLRVDESGRVLVRLHCTHTGGHKVVSVFVEALGRCVGLTGESQWFDSYQLTKV